MDSQAIAKLTRESISRLTSDEYLTAHNDPTTGKEFASKVNEIENGPRTPSTRPQGSVRGPEAQTPAQVQSFDPSFDGDEQPAPAPAPVAAAPAPAQPAAMVTDCSQLPELEHSYQPMVDGKRAGGLQKFKYRTVNDPNDPNSLVMQLQRAHSYASARIRTLSRDRKLDSIASAGAAPRIQPEKEVPATVEGLAAELRAQRESNFALSVRAAVNEFQASVDWTKYRSDENAKSVILAVERAADDPTDPASYQRAFHNMRDYLEPVSQPVAAPVPAVEPAPVVVEQPKAPAVRPATTARIATGLNNDNQFNPEVEAAPVKVQGVRIVMPSGKTEVLTLAAYDKLSTDVQKRILRNGSNQAAIEALTVAEDQAKAARRGGR